MKAGVTVFAIAVCAALAGCITPQTVREAASGEVTHSSTDLDSVGRSRYQHPPANSVSDGVAVSVPGLEFASWYQYPTDVERDPNHVFVLEFWATWCGACRLAIPDLNLVHTVFYDQVTLVAVTSEGPEEVEPFLRERKGAMEFAVVRDDERRSLWRMYMAEYGESGIPHAFLIQNGEVLWHGHSSLLLTEALPMVLSADVVETRLSERPRADFQVSISHAGVAFSDHSDAKPRIRFSDTRSNDPIGADSIHELAPGTFEVRNARVGSYRAEATAFESNGRTYRGWDVVYNAGGLVTLDVQELISVVEPDGCNGRVELDLLLPEEGFTVRWRPVETAARYDWYLAALQDGRFEPIDQGVVESSSVHIPATSLTSGTKYRLTLNGYDSAGVHVATQWVAYSDGSRSSSLMFRAR